MGMFDSTQPFDAQTFNYASEQDKLKRKRAIADGLMAAKQPGQTQIVPGGANGYAVRNSALTNLGPMLQQLVGAYLSGKSDDDQKALDKNSLDAFGQQYAGLGKNVRDPAQDGVEASAEMSREARRGQGSDGSDGQAVSDAFDNPATTSPVSNAGPVTMTDLPASPVSSVNSSPVKKLAVAQAGKLLGAGAGRGLVNPALANAQTAPDAPPDEPIYDADGNMIGGGTVGDGIGVMGGMRALAGKLLPGIDPLSKGPSIAPSAPAQGPAPVAPMPGPQAAQPAQPVPALPAGPAPVPAMPAPQAAQPAAPQPQDMPQGPGSAADPYSRAPTQQDMVSRLIALGRTGPEGQQIAAAQLNQLFASKNGRFSTTVHADPVNGGFVQVTTDSQTGQSGFKPISAAGGNEKILDTKVGSDGNLLERTSHGWRPAQMQGGGSVMTQEGQAAQAKDTDAKAADLVKLGDMKQQMSSMQELVPLISKVGTGRLQTPLNSLTAFFTNSDDLDKMNRAFSTQKLEGAVQWLKGQGSVSDSERKLLAESQFDPKGSTQSNLEYANKVIGMLKKHIPIAQSAFDTKYGTGTGTGTAPPQGGMLYSWQKK